MQKIQAWSLGQEEPPENGMATHLSILAGKIPRTEEPGGLYSPWDYQEPVTTEFPRDVVPKYHKMGVLKERNCLTVLEARRSV